MASGNLWGGLDTGADTSRLCLIDDRLEALAGDRAAADRAVKLDLDGKEQEGEFDGLMSVCLQHEVDHLNGVLFIDHLSRLKRDMIVKKVVKARGTRGSRAL